MIDNVLTVLSVIADVRVALELTSAVSRYIYRKKAIYDAEDLRRDARVAAERELALETTFDEWERIAISLQPSMKNEMGSHNVKDLYEQSELLTKLIEVHPGAERLAPRRKLEELTLQHTGFVRTADGRLKLKLGLSNQTECLFGDSVEVPNTGKGSYNFPLRDPLGPIGEHHMTLPVFKVTMLGDSGSGKTDFMSSMYTKMRQNFHQIAIRAPSNDVDLELVQHLENIYVYDKWPLGTARDLRQYEFELLLSGESIARIDWVDYRGGAISDPEDTAEAQALNERLRQSHSIIWMIDMSKVTGQAYDGTIARLKTGMLRLSSLSQSAMAGANHFRSILFVRSKSDLVQDAQGEVEWNRACGELVTHLGDTLALHKVPFCAVIPVSSVGRVRDEKKTLGDEPHNVEWPLILSLAFMLEADLQRLKHDRRGAEANLKVRQTGALQLLRNVVGLGPTADEWNAALEYSRISREMFRMKDVIGNLLKDTPSTIKVYKR